MINSKYNTPREAWEAISRGEKVSDDTLEQLISEAEAALPYLNHRGPEYRLVQRDTHQLLQTLKGYRLERQRQGDWAPAPKEQEFDKTKEAYIEGYSSGFYSAYNRVQRDPEKSYLIWKSRQ